MRRAFAVILLTFGFLLTLYLASPLIIGGNTGDAEESAAVPAEKDSVLDENAAAARDISAASDESGNNEYSGIRTDAGEGSSDVVENYHIVKYNAKYTDCNIENKFYLFGEDAKFLLKRVVPDTSAAVDAETEISVFSISGKSGTVIYRDRETGEWKSMLPGEGIFDSVLFFQTDDSFSIIGPAVSYRPYGEGNLREVGERGEISFRETGAGYEVVLRMSGIADEVHLWMCSVKGLNYEWDDEGRQMWERLDFGGMHRICFDGAYYLSPAAYKPYEEGMYYRCPAVHPSIVLLHEEDRIAGIMAFALLDEALTHQNEDGYWPTPAESDWLLRDYGINSHFYDTRFNNDVTMRLFESFEKFGNRNHLDAALRQTEWLMRHAADNHIKAEEGILVEDYGVAKGDRKVSQTHSSLNHQLQEIKVLLTAFVCTGEKKYFEFAEDLLDGIRSTEHKWYNGSRGLAYGIRPDGTPGFNDYPYLTYNDLYEVQEILVGMGEERDPVLDRLMAHKLKYMLENGITGYKTYDENEMPPILKAVPDMLSKSKQD